MAAMCNPRNVFLRLNRFPLKKNGTFDFETIGYVNSSLTFACCSHKYQFDETSETDILILDNLDEGAAIFTT